VILEFTSVKKANGFVARGSVAWMPAESSATTQVKAPAS
jgi:hypothetical protein